MKLWSVNWSVRSPDTVGSKNAMVNTHIYPDLKCRVKIFLEQPSLLLRDEFVGRYFRPPVVVFMPLVLRFTDFSQVLILGQSLTQSREVFHRTIYTMVSNFNTVLAQSLHLTDALC